MKKANSFLILCLCAALSLVWLGLASAEPVSTSTTTVLAAEAEPLPGPEPVPVEACATKNPPAGTNGWTNKGEMCKNAGASCGTLKVCADHVHKDFLRKINTYSCSCDGANSAPPETYSTGTETVESSSQRTCG